MTSLQERRNVNLAVVPPTPVDNVRQPLPENFDYTKPMPIPKNEYPDKLPAYYMRGHPYLGDDSDIFAWGRVEGGIPFEQRKETKTRHTLWPTSNE